MSLKMDKRNLTEIRKSLIWSIPLFLLLLTMSIWSILYSLYQTVDDLNKLAPSVRITPFVPIALCVPIISITGIIIAIQKSVPCTEDAMKIPTRIFLSAIAVGVFIMFFCIFAVTPLQYYAMPKLGYTRCNILEDHPTIYFTDWVKNPDWCVRGKSRKWVNEQARLGK